MWPQGQDDAWFGLRTSTPHLRLVWVVVVVHAEISDLLLGADGRRRGVLSIWLIKEVVLGFFSHTVFWLMPALIDLAGDEFRKAPLVISSAPDTCRLLDWMEFRRAHLYS
jgi:hypothetical protein